ncbi:ribosomal protein S6 kinase-related protein-like isoform X2 [Vespa velutina]|uniref:ribosomal protein S6 kinase-related protein-like isoform X2 n=1 Tax=Vespa velutina TaxID=202808 RepID=UPI001FB3A949|nr:ribosomal protein S6 kinase-related protein-like isoform X2 [Vespa velutina]
MGNSNVKKKYHDHQKYASQYSLIDIIGGSCAGSTRSFQVEIKSWSRSSYRSSSKTAWPIPRSEAIFLPEFKVRKMTLNTEYSFLDVIAKGAYGRVYKVQSRENRQVFALKVISKAKIITENAVTQAKQEVAIQRMVGHHPFIVNSTHRWQSSKTLYILTDYMCGGELFSLVEKYGCLPEQVVRIYVAEVALAIDFLHNAGVVHRDLKATNILLDEEGHAMIIDFGLSKWLHRTQRTNTFCGTPEYMGNSESARARARARVSFFYLKFKLHSPYAFPFFINFSARNFKKAILWSRSRLVVSWCFDVLSTHQSESGTLNPSRTTSLSRTLRAAVLGMEAYSNAMLFHCGTEGKGKRG